jgi:hypothetical protein
MQGEDRPSGPFPNVSNLNAPNAIFNDVGRDSHNHYRSSGDIVNNIQANVAGNFVVFVPAAPTTSQQTPAIPSPPDQFGLPWRSTFWRFQTPFPGTAVTLETPDLTAVDSPSNPQAMISISSDPTDTQPFLIGQAAAPEAPPSQALACEPYPSESEREDKSPQPGDTGSNVVSICTNTFLDGP